VLVLVYDKVLDTLDKGFFVFVARIGRVEVGVGQPILKTESLACKFKVFFATLEDDVAESVGIGFPAFSLVSPSEHAAAFRVAGTRHIVREFLLRVLRILGKIADLVESELVAGLDAAEV